MPNKILNTDQFNGIIYDLKILYKISFLIKNNFLNKS
jgi:hypothetical protein